MLRGSLRITGNAGAARRCFRGTGSPVAQRQDRSCDPAPAHQRHVLRSDRPPTSSTRQDRLLLASPSRYARGSSPPMPLLPISPIFGAQSQCVAFFSTTYAGAPGSRWLTTTGPLTASYAQRRRPDSARFASLSKPVVAFSSSASHEFEDDEGGHLELYMWGTDTKGSLLKPADRADEKILDVPRPIEGAAFARFYLQSEASDDDAASSSSSSSEDAPKLARVVCGSAGTAYLLSDGSCYVTGENKYGQLGVGHKDPVTKPAPLVLPSPARGADDDDEGDNQHDDDRGTTPKDESSSSNAVTVADVALGPAFTAAVDSLGNLYTCGFGGSVMAGFGMLGHGTAESTTHFKQVMSLVEDQCRVRQVQVGESHMVVLTTEGEVLTCGAGSYGRLGNFDTVDQLCLEPVEVLTVDHKVVHIASGKAYTLALTEYGVLYGWGRNHQGQLGVGLGLAVDMYAMQNIPEPIKTDELVNRKVIKVSAGPSHAACITSGGELFYWGMGLHLEPQRVNALLHTQVVDVACGKEYTIAKDVDGRLYSFGKGKNGCLGQGGAVKQLHQATRMEAFRDDQTILQVSAGWDHAACLVRSPPGADNE